MRRVAIFLVATMAVWIAAPHAVAKPGRGFPWSWTFPSWAAAVAAPDTPAQGIGKVDPGKHYVDAEVTKAKQANGRAPDRVREGVEGYQPYQPKLIQQRIATTTTGAPQIDMRFPPNNWESSSLTPQLVARGHDTDSYPNTGLKYRFYVFKADTGALLSDSNWLSTTMWTVPSGVLEWGKSYLYTVDAYDNSVVSPEIPAYLFSTPVPQPVLSSRFGHDEHKGYEPGTGNYTTSETDAEIDTVGPPLAVERFYNSIDTRVRQAFGRGWFSIVDSEAVETKDASGLVQTVTVSYPDGQEVAFGRLPNGKYAAPDGRFATLTPTVANGVITAYTLADKDATAYRFARNVSAGVFRISSVTDANGRALTISYNPDHTPKWMRSAVGRSLYFTWATPAGSTYPHIVEVATDPEVPGQWPTAKTWQYTYDNDRLVKVCNPTTWTYCTRYEYRWINQYPNAVYNEGPVSFWRLNEPAGATISSSAVDTNAGVDNAVYRNVTLGQPPALEHSGSASAAFNGTSSYVELPGKLVVEGSYQSISLWFKTTAVNGVLFSYNQDPITNGTTPVNFTPALYVGSDGKLRGEFWQGNAGTPITSGTAVNDGAWHHVVLSANGNSQTLYLDGYAQGTLSGTIGQIPQGTNHVYVGAGFLGGGWPAQPYSGQLPARATYFNGAIADVAYFGRALPPATASQLFGVGRWPRSALAKVIRPSGGISAQVSYDDVTGKVTSITDDNGATWTFGKPVVSGNSNVYAGAVLGGKPIDYWRLSDPAGTIDTTNEVLGGKATYTGAVTLQVPGPFADAKAAKFNGASSYVELSNRNVPVTAPTTISLWFNMPAGSSAGGVLYSYQQAPMTDLSAGNSWTPAIYIGNDGKLRGGLWTGSASSPMTVSTPVNDGKWHHVALTAGGNNQVFYLDGAQVATRNATIQGTTATRAYLGAGKWDGAWPSHTGVAGYFPGSIADFAYHQTKLSEEQIEAQFQAATRSAPLELTMVGGAVKPIPMPVATVEVTGPAGVKRAYSYDLLKGRRLIQERDTLGNLTRYGYDAGGYGNLTFDARGVRTEAIRDVRGNVLQSITCQDQAANRCSSVYFTYFPDATSTSLTPDARNDVVLSKRDGRSASATDNTYLTSYSYDGKGNQTEIAEPLGRKTVISYTDGTTIAAADGGFAPPGLPYKVVSPSGTTETVTYFVSGDVASQVDANGLKTTYTYDGLGRKVTETEYTNEHPNGLTTTFTYDAVGKVLSETAPGTTNRVTGAVHTLQTVHKYNVDGQEERTEFRDTTGGDATRVESVTYNAFGQVRSETDATGATAWFEYDSYGSLVKETEPTGDATINTYDSEGNLLTIVAAGFTGDPNNPSAPANLLLESNAYDPVGRPASKKDAMGWTTRYAYTDNGLPAKVTRTDGTTTFVISEHVYDAASNLVTEMTNNGATTSVNTYDAANRLTSTILDPNGLKRTTTYQYSKTDDVLSETDTDTDGTVVGLRQFMYDAEGNEIAETTYRANGIVPIGRWKLNGNAADSAGNSPLSTNGYVTWTGGHGGAVAINNAGYLSSAGPSIDSYNSFTATAWVNLTSGEGYRRILAATGTTQDAFDLRYQQDVGKWIFHMHKTDTNSSPSAQAVSTSSAALSTWTHLAATYDATNGQMRLYVNGVLEGTQTSLGTFPATGPMMIGAGLWNGGPVERWIGEISDVQFYQRALTAAEIGQVKGGSAPAPDATVIRETSRLDERGLPKVSVDALGNVTDHAHDELGRATQTTGAAMQTETGGGAPVSARPVDTVGYDTFGAATHKRNATGDVTVLGYDAEGRLVSTTMPSYTQPGASAPITAVARTAYDSMGRIKSVKDPLNHETLRYYDQLGRLSKVVAADGGVHTYTYDHVGNRLSTVDPEGAKATASYDYMRRVVTSSQIERVPTAAVHTTSYGYHPSGWLAQTRTPRGVVTSATYNAAGERKTTTDGANNTTTYTYDGAGRLSQVTRPDSTSTVHAYDLAGNDLSIKDYSATGALLRTESMSYDASQRLVAATDPRSTTTTFTYDAHGNLLGQNEPISTTDSILTRFGYDLEGRRTRMTDGRGSSFITTYNSWGLEESVIEPSTSGHPATTDRTFTTTYDAAGRRVKHSEPGGVVVGFEWDAVGRILRQAGAGAEAVTAERVFDYDRAGRMTGLSGNTLTYNDRGLLMSVSGPSGNSSYGYDADGEMASRTDAAGTTTYAYDTAGRLSTVANPGTAYRETLNYNNMSLVNKATYGNNGNFREFGYDGLHRLKLDELKSASSTSVAKIAYYWDANGNEISKTTTGLGTTSTNTYSYDLADRLISWNATNYAYDKAGNRTSNGVTTFTYDERSRLRTGGDVSYVYSPRGTLRATVTGTVSVPTEADSFGQVIKQGTETYAYDGLGRVMRPGFAYTGLGNDLAADGQATYVRDPDGGLLGVNSLVAWTDLHTDLVGQFGDTATGLAGSRSFDPLGRVVANAGMATNLGFQSEWTDPKTGRVNMLARWYNPATGQFDTRDRVANDPFPNSIAANAYQYGNGNPLTMTDPSGQYVEPGTGKSRPTPKKSVGKGGSSGSKASSSQRRAAEIAAQRRAAERAAAKRAAAIAAQARKIAAQKRAAERAAKRKAIAAQAKRIAAQKRAAERAAKRAAAIRAKAKKAAAAKRAAEQAAKRRAQAGKGPRDGTRNVRPGDKSRADRIAKQRRAADEEERKRHASGKGPEDNARRNGNPGINDGGGAASRGKGPGTRPVKWEPDGPDRDERQKQPCIDYVLLMCIPPRTNPNDGYTPAPAKPRPGDGFCRAGGIIIACPGPKNHADDDDEDPGKKLPPSVPPEDQRPGQVVPRGEPVPVDPRGDAYTKATARARLIMAILCVVFPLLPWCT